MLVIGHRGASADAPENTMPAFRLALDQGAGFVEADLHLSRDGVLVLIHDATLKRTTDGRGRVSAMTIAELQQLDAGSWFGDRAAAPSDKKRGDTKRRDSKFSGTRIPTLEQLLELARERDAGLFLELKTPASPDLAPATVRALRAAGARRRSVVISFDLPVLSAVRKLDATLAVGYLCTRARGAVSRATKIAARYLLPRADCVTPAMVAAAHAQDLKVVVWTVNDPALMRTLAKAGVDGMISNIPGTLAALARSL